MKKGELVKKVALAAGKGVAIGVLMAFPPLALPFQTIMEIIEEMEGRKPERKKIKRVLYNLKKRKLISLKEINGELVATFNEGGKKLVLQYKFDELTIKKPRKWDGKWRLVVFDIPERQRKSRVNLRKKLKELGFYQLQRSVLVHPFECQREIELVARFYQVEPYLYFIRADYLDNEKKIKEKFGF